MITFSHTKKRLETKGSNITAFQKVQGDHKSCLGSENEGSRPGMIVEVNDLFSDEIFTTTMQDLCSDKTNGALRLDALIC